jgi:hypothetical protein
MVFADEIANPQNVFIVAASRVTEIGIGVLSTGLVLRESERRQSDLLGGWK